MTNDVYFKNKEKESFIRYSPIGSFVIDGREDPFPRADHIEEWIKLFQSSNIAEILQIVNYCMLYSFYEEGVGSFIDQFGQEVGKIFEGNHQLFKQILNRWIEPDSPILKGLMFDLDDVEDEIERKIHNRYNYLVEIEFKDGSILKPVSDPMEKVEKKVFDSDGNLLEVVLMDGTVIHDEKETWRWYGEWEWNQQYVLSSDYDQLLADLKALSDCFTDSERLA